MAESRNVLSYVKAQRKALKLETQYRAKLEKLEPLKRKVEEAKFVATTKKMRLNGGQMMRAIAVLNQLPIEEIKLSPMKADDLRGLPCSIVPTTEATSPGSPSAASPRAISS